MGVWGSGLYSGDFALDLRSSIRALARLPYDGERIVEILTDINPDVAEHRENEDHTTFWLVIADQFARRGIRSDRAKENALEIIDGGIDLETLSTLGMQSSDLNKRRKVLEGVRARATAPMAAHQRPHVLKKPQEFLMDVGDVLVYPTCNGKCINPYFKSKEQDSMFHGGWKHGGWAAAVIVDRGRAFDFLSWYRPITVTKETIEKPTLMELRGEVQWKLEPAGTCSRLHWTRLELERIGRLSIDQNKLHRVFPGMRPGTINAIEDISIANRLSVGPSVAMVRYSPDPTISSIEELLSTPRA
jgi:hypothetical protein